jgi:hypothetical protein
MKNARNVKDMLYEQVARIGKVFSSSKRLELIDLLCQGEKTRNFTQYETDQLAFARVAHGTSG